MRRAIGFLLLLLAIGAVGVVVGRSFASPRRAPTRGEVLSDVGFNRVVAEVDFRATPFDEAIDFIRQRTSANLVVRWRELESVGVETKTPITLRVANLPLRRVLELVCEEAGGGNVVIEARGHGGAIVISSDEDAARFIETRLYDVQDLVRAHYDFRRRLGWEPPADDRLTGGTAGGSGGGSGAGSGGGSLFGMSPSAAEPYEQAIETLTRMITEYVAPESWRDNGGTLGSVRDFNGRLMITATPDMHDDIAALLELLRKGT